MLLLLRKFVQGIYGFEAIAFLSALPITIYIYNTHQIHNPDLDLQALFAGATAISLLGIIFGLAWRGISKGERWARGWVIAASCINLLVSLPILYFGRVSLVNILWCLPVSGFAGLYLFLSPMAKADVTLVSKVDRRRVKGDGTSLVLDGFAWCLGAVGGYCAYGWCIWKMLRLGIPQVHGLAIYLQIGIISLAIVLVHEFGHAFIGWGVGMKLRSFAFGPFRWQMRDGKWEFEFQTALIFSSSGATGAVPASLQHQVWQDLLMVAAGPTINFATGTVAFCAALLLDPGSPWQLHGSLLIFAAFSFVAGCFNLVPMRVQSSYSDGARLYQMLNGGPAADLHNVFAFVSAGLVTPLRPGDFDVAMIERSVPASRGVQTPLLRLFQYEHYLELERIPEAIDALDQAEAAYQQCATEVPAGLHTALIFGIAYLHRDARRTREYWSQMEAAAKRSKKRQRRNADYWLAECALHWCERNYEYANQAWRTGAIIAQGLPEAGTYDFDRYRYHLMRKALDEGSTGYTFSLEMADGETLCDVAS